MRYRLRHSSLYSYGSPVELAAHMVHLRPRPLPGQRILWEQILTTPQPARRHDGHDHFGNHVTWFFLDLPHEGFEVTAESAIEVAFPPPPPPETTPPWETVAEAARTPIGWRAAEYSFGSPLAPRHPDTTAYAAVSFTPGRPILSALLELNARIKADFAYKPGVTQISTSVDQVIKQKAGVCQDFSHVMISGLRGLGLPTRYVSGYIRTIPPPGRERLAGADQSHAWVGSWLGPDFGWIDLDPTNGLVVSDQHVVVGWGRDYHDVSPVQGVILGGGEHDLQISVDMETEPSLP